jgi:hypothetical protein
MPAWLEKYAAHIEQIGMETRSLSTVDNFVGRWAGRPVEEAALALGFEASVPR